jgi:hypothetical protein
MEAAMNPTSKFIWRWWIYPAAAFALLATSACNFGPSVKKTEEKPAASNSTSAAQARASSLQNVTDPGLDMNCVFDHIQNPQESFHYSYVKSGDNLVDEEADITPQTIDGSFKNTSISRPIHGVHSDSASWQGAWSGLMGISGMSSTIALVNHSSAMTLAGPESVNGYNAIKYSIDTTEASGAEAGLYKSTLGAGGFEKGTVWVIPGGCPVKISLDSEMHLNDGSVDKVHYEEAMIKK